MTTILLSPGNTTRRKQPPKHRLILGWDSLLPLLLRRRTTGSRQICPACTPPGNVETQTRGRLQAFGGLQAENRTTRWDRCLCATGEHLRFSVERVSNGWPLTSGQANSQAREAAPTRSKTASTRRTLSSFHVTTAGLALPFRLTV